jgi:preprotein translocase subunit SecY
MFNTLRNAWKVPDIRKKMLYTVMMLLVYRIGAHVPVPGVDASIVASKITDSSFGQFINLFSGGLSSFSLFALGIMPYITAQIIMQLLTMAIPALERMQKEGPEGRKKLASITRYAGVALGLIQAVSMLLVWVGDEALLATGTPMILTQITIVMCLTAGTALIIWIGEKITENGVGNGISLLIYVSIISRIPSAGAGIISGINDGTTSYFTGIILLVAALMIIVGITFIDMGERRIPVQYAKRVIGRKIYGGQSTHIPMKINQSGVLPLIFAVTLVQFPQMIIQMIGGPGSDAGYKAVMDQDKPLYMIVLALLIFFFTFFYSQVSFNTVDIAKNMQQNGGFIPGIRAGKPTSDYLQKILVRITLFAAIFLAVVATLPMGLSALAKFNLGFGATSLLIMVNVALETTRQLESHLMMRHYKGFLK